MEEDFWDLLRERRGTIFFWMFRLCFVGLFLLHQSLCLFLSFFFELARVPRFFLVNFFVAMFFLSVFERIVVGVGSLDSLRRYLCFFELAVLMCVCV